MLRGMLSSSISSSSTFEVWSICSICELLSISPFVVSFVLIIDEMALEDSWLDLKKVFASRFVVAKILHRYLHSY